VRRKSPTPAVDTFRLLDTLRLHFSALVIDDDEMQSGCLEQARKVFHPRMSRSAFCSEDDLTRHSSAYREFALTKVSDRARCPNVSICRKLVHKSKRGLPSSAAGNRGPYWDLPNWPCGQLP
jgi:hypothetical protein